MVLAFISNELLTSGSHIKCIIIHESLCADKIFVDRKSVHVTLKSLNLEGVAFRHSHQFHKQKRGVQGPNALWHIDGSNELKSFGFSIHGCITAQKMKFSIKDYFSKYEQIRRKLVTFTQETLNGKIHFLCIISMGIAERCFG